MFYHNTIRRYTLLLLNKFKNLEIQYKDSNGNIITKNIPIHYKVQEKEFLIQNDSEEQIVTGNTNVIPRATLELTGISPNTERQMSKYLKINRLRVDHTKDHRNYDDIQNYAEFQYNCVSYDFSFSLNILCRGMSEVCQIIEEVAPKFNPIIYFDIYDAENESEPTRVPLTLGSISFSSDGLDESSVNLFTVSFDMTLSGYLFQPVNAYSTIKKFIINLQPNEVVKEQMTFNVKNCYPQLQPDIKYFDYSKIQINIISLTKTNDEITVTYESNVTPSIVFECEGCEVDQNGTDTCKLLKSNQTFAITAVLTYGNVVNKITREFTR